MANDMNESTNNKQLMCRMAPLLGGDLSRRVFLDRFGTLSGDSLFHVRKICAANFGEFCSVVGQQVTENYLVSISKLYPRPRLPCLFVYFNFTHSPLLNAHTQIKKKIVCP
jgi:hypothetical protein